MVSSADSRSLLYSFVASDEVSEGPLEPSAYAQALSTTNPRLSAVGGDSIDDISFADPEVVFSDSLSSNAVDPHNPFPTEAPEGGSIEARTTVAKPQLYTIQPGDTIASIASSFGISVDTVQAANGLSNADHIKPGDTLSILPINGVLYKVKSGDTISEIARAYDVGAPEIVSYNALESDNKLSIGDKLIIPGAKPHVASTESSSHAVAAVEADDEPVPTPAPVQSGEGMLWPTVSRHISQYFKWGHTGIDIDNRSRPPVYAAQDGVVKMAQRLGGYGNLVVLQHADGKETYYGHLDKFYVSAGDKVNKGDSIGKMGSTGHSTGPHVHFEVRIGGRPVNPLTYL